jgi:hypothetical protein
MARKSSPEKSAAGEAKLREFLQTRPVNELVELLLRFAREHEEVGEQLNDSVTIQTADMEELIEQARKEILERTEEIVDSRPWAGNHIPDYSKLKSRFEALFQVGAPDALVELGRDLFNRGQAQIEGASDNGETHKAIHECLKITYEALNISTRSPVEKILFAIDLHNGDGFGLS